MSSNELDELLALLEKHQDTPGSEMEHFIKQHGIVASEKKCTVNQIIFWVYLKWKMKTGGEPLPRSSFFKQFKKYFKPASRDRVRRYYVQSQAFLLHPDDVAKAMSEARQERRWQSQRRVAKKLVHERNRKNEYWRKAVAARKEKSAKRRSGI